MLDNNSHAFTSLISESIKRFHPGADVIKEGVEGVLVEVLITLDPIQE